MGKKYTGRLLSFNAYFGISIIPLLLLFRFVAENYFVWLVPFLSIFALGNKRVKYLLWALTSVAFLSSITNSLLPYYMLPMAPWIGGFLAGLLSVATPYRVSSAGAVASTFSVGKIFLVHVAFCGKRRNHEPRIQSRAKAGRAYQPNQEALALAARSSESQNLSGKSCRVLIVARTTHRHVDKEH
jgi:hypothetical protein